MSDGSDKRHAEQGKMVKGVFSDVYRFYLKYHGRSLDEKVCREKSEDAGRLLERYGYSSFCDRMLLNVLMQLEEESR